MKRNDFVYSDEREPHRLRTKKILKEHPEVRHLISKNPYTGLFICLLVGLQILLAFFIKDRSWWWVFGTAYIAGAVNSGTNAIQTTTAGLYIDTAVVNGTGTVGTSHGLFVKAQTGATTNWAITSFGNMQILNSGILQLGNAYASVVNATVVAALNKTIVLYDSNGVAVTVPCY